MSNPAAPAGPLLVGFIASNILTQQKLVHFRCLLDSIRAQTQPLDALYVSCHVAPALAEQVEWQELFGDFSCKVTTLRQKSGTKRLFVQYAELLEGLPMGGQSFILFSEDDALWHADRVAAYRTVMQQGVPPHIAAVVTCEASKHLKRDCIAAHDVRTPQEVDSALLPCGCWALSFPEATNGRLYDYERYAVRPAVLKDFVAQYPQLIRANRFADMQFAKFVAEYRQGVCGTGRIDGLSQWLYFDRRSALSAIVAPDVAADPRWPIKFPAVRDAYAAQVGEAISCPVMHEIGLRMMESAMDSAASDNEASLALIKAFDQFTPNVAK